MVLAGAQPPHLFSTIHELSKLVDGTGGARHDADRGGRVDDRSGVAAAE